MYIQEIKKIEPSKNGFKSRVEAVASVIMWEDIKAGAVRYSEVSIEDYLPKAQKRISEISQKDKKTRRQNYGQNNE